MARMNKTGRTRGLIRTTIRKYADVSKKPFNAMELHLAKDDDGRALMTEAQATQNCVQLCREGELRRVEPGVYQATKMLKVA